MVRRDGLWTRWRDDRDREIGQGIWEESREEKREKAEGRRAASGRAGGGLRSGVAAGGFAGLWVARGVRDAMARQGAWELRASVLRGQAAESSAMVCYEVSPLGLSQRA